jgi:hypothetical protein
MIGTPIERQAGPETRTMPMPPRPGAVAMAAMVSEEIGDIPLLP